MASPLNKVKKQIAAGFKGKLKKGTLRKVGAAVSLNSLGDPASGAVTTYQFDGIRSTFSAYYRTTLGIPDTDVSILVIAGSLPNAVEPAQDDLIFIEAKWFKVRKVLDIDPAGASYQLQAHEVDAP